MELDITKPVLERSLAARERKGITRIQMISDVLERFDDQFLRDLKDIKEGATFKHILQEASIKPGEDGYDARSIVIANEVNSLLEDFLNYKFRIPLADNPDFSTDKVRKNLVLSHHAIFAEKLCSEPQATALVSTVLYSADIAIDEILGRNPHTNMTFKEKIRPTQLTCSSRGSIILPAPAPHPLRGKSCAVVQARKAGGQRFL